MADSKTPDSKNAAGPNAGLNAAAQHLVDSQRLTADNATLVLIDYMTGLMLGCQTLNGHELRNNAVALTKLGKLFKLPTILLGDEGTPLGPMMPEIEAANPDLQRVPRLTPSAMREPGFVDALKKIGRRHLILAGITTDNCVQVLALDAVRAGYHVYVVVDASATWSTQLEQAAFARLTQAGVGLTNWVALSNELLTSWKTPEGEGVMQLMAEHTGYIADLMNNAKAGTVSLQH